MVKKVCAGIAALGLAAALITAGCEHDSSPEEKPDYKLPPVYGEDLLDLTQEYALKYFTDYAHPDCGMARERKDNGRDLDLVTTGGTGFGVMAMLAGTERGFIDREEAAARIAKIVNFLGEIDTYHGAYAHWYYGNTGETVTRGWDDGADLVETAFLFQGLLTAYEYFKNGTDQAEQDLCDSIQTLWKAIEWTWFQNNRVDTLFWHWSPNPEKYPDLDDNGFRVDFPLRGWNESLIVYVLAASSPTHGIAKEVYAGWGGSSILTNNTYYDIELPMESTLGFARKAKGGPLFFTHYSFLGLDPRGLKDENIDYWKQVTAQAKINHLYCIDNPFGWKGYSSVDWGLTASNARVPNTPVQYNASYPSFPDRDGDRGVIAPTAALSSFPYTPNESMGALENFYNNLGGILWGEHGFFDAYRPDGTWYDTGYLAIDQGPIVVMIENYRSGLLWGLFMGNEDVQNGLSKLGFTSNPDN
ncbi:MAG: DUF3131 domain-containing protein [Treponema sp.]|nr:DUF3131 domain-containing protein [Treponema sp.]